MIPVIDMHCDTISCISWEADAGHKVGLRKNEYSVDLEKLKGAGYMCQSFALYTNLNYVKDKGRTPWENVNRLSDILDGETEANADIIRPAFSGTDMEKNFSQGFLSSLKTVEEGAVYEGSIEKLKALYDKGVRKSTITWNFENELGFPNKRVDCGVDDINDSWLDTENGLKPMGFEFIHAMEDIGIIIDISHLNDAGIKDVFETVKSKTPVIASHSNARGVTMHPRNLSDEVIRNIADHGGITGINFASAFMAEGITYEYVTKISDMIRHIKYIKNKGGIDMIGFGSDFDGIENKVEIGDASGMQRIADAMSLEGFTSDEIEKVFYKNALRVYKEVLG